METVNKILGILTKKQYIMIFLPLSIIMLGICIVLNINMQKAQVGTDYTEVSVEVENVERTTVKGYGATANIDYAYVNYNGESYKMKISNYEYNTYKGKIGQMVDGYLTKDNIMYSNPNSIPTPSSTIYFICLGLEVIFVGLLIYGFCLKKEIKEN